MNNVDEIIVLNDFANTQGGADKIALSSAIGLANAGKNVSLFTAVAPINSELREKNIDVICLNQEEIRNIDNKFKSISIGLWNSYAAYKFEELLKTKNNRTTLIHLHGWTKALSSAPIKKAIQMNFKILCTLHDYFTACPNGGFFNYKKNSICKLKAMSASCVLSHCDKASYPQKLFRVLRQIVQKKAGLIPDGIDHFISISVFSKSLLRPYLPDSAMIHDIQNPIDISKQHKIEPDNNKQFIWIGRVSPEKGPEDFLKVANELNLNAKVIGDGELLQKLKQKYPNINFTGWLSSDKVKRELTLSRALVFTSRLYETQGLVVAEAQSLGIPVIVADTAAATESVVDGETGLLYKTGDLDELKNKIEMLQDNDLVKAISDKAYHDYWENPSTMDNYINELLNLYEFILNQN